jgi:inosine-uridine nucleoside N-ribohydrolase
MCVDIELNGAMTRGATIADRRRNVTPERLNADVCVEVDGGRYSHLFVETLAGFGR